jgi:cytochrome c553
MLAASAGFATTAKENWNAQCASCHGKDGKGRVSKEIELRDYTDAKVQAKLTDEYIIKATAEGVILDGKELMKAYKNDLSTREIKALATYIRKFKK